MSWLGRIFGSGGQRSPTLPPEEPPAPPSGGHNLLVVSDVHLGETAKDRSRISFLKAASVSDREFCDLLEYYQQHSPGDRPWRLILAGDIIDFLQITFTPDPRVPGQDYEFEISAEELQVGLDNSADKVRWKLLHVMDRHQRFFTYLADFIGQGNELVFIRGNHDAEMFWHPVHAAFKERLVQIYFGGERVEGQTPDEFLSRIQFHPWFYYESGLIFLEHGHQYDRYSSLEHLLYPAALGNPAYMEWPMISLVIRHSVNRIQGMSTHDKDEWDFLDYIRWVMGLKTPQIFRIVWIYAAMCGKVCAYAFHRRRADATEVREIHGEVLRSIASDGELDLGTLQALEKLQVPPVHLTLPGLLNSTYLDRWSLVALDILLVAGLAVTGVSDGTWIGATLGIAVANVGLLWWMARELDTRIAPKQRVAAQKVQRLVDTRYVVMGHSHVPEVVPLDEGTGASYINTGSWLHYAGSSPHPDDDCDCGLTHLVVTPLGEDESESAELRRWCTQGHNPVAWVRKGVDPQ